MVLRRSLVLGLVGAVVLIGLVLLLLRVTETPATEVDEDKLAEAEANYRRAQAAAERARGDAPRESVPVLPPRPPEPEVADDGEDAPPERMPPLARREPPRLRNPELMKLSQTQAVGVQGAGLKERMDDVNSLYDKADYERARDAAVKVLEEFPKQVRMLRVAISTSCLMGDQEQAAQYFERLERDRDRRQMARRCARYGIEFELDP